MGIDELAAISWEHAWEPDEDERIRAHYPDAVW